MHPREHSAVSQLIFPGNTRNVAWANLNFHSEETPQQALTAHAQGIHDNLECREFLSKLVAARNIEGFPAGGIRTL